LINNANLLTSMFLLSLGWDNLYSIRMLDNLGLWCRSNRWRMHHKCKQGKKYLLIVLKGHNMVTYAMACTDKSACIEETT
jgi:hypothetical protein